MTPNLSFSPSSTDSSSGDRTIQMSSFLDDLMAPFGIPGSTGSEIWPSLDRDPINPFSKVSPPLNQGLDTFSGNANSPVKFSTVAPAIIGYARKIQPSILQPIRGDASAWLLGMENFRSQLQLVNGPCLSSWVLCKWSCGISNWSPIRWNSTRLLFWIGMMRLRREITFRISYNPSTTSTLLPRFSFCPPILTEHPCHLRTPITHLPTPTIAIACFQQPQTLLHFRTPLTLFLSFPCHYLSDYL